MKAIRNRRVFLLILNKNANASQHVLNEINAAFERLKEEQPITLLPFRIDDCVLSDDVYYYLSRFHIMDGVLPPEFERVQELVDRVCMVLARFEAEGYEVDTCFVYDMLGQPLMERSDFDTALEYSHKTYDILLPRVGPEHIDVAHNLRWRDNIYRAMEEKETATGCYRQSAAIFEKRAAQAHFADVLARLEAVSN